ncbi:hypothetical protein RJ639_016912 [Escallonia herrerae]|uniref:Uncharacterized protein n=1 Tax=Escallonia herrerae TaxID=1293975 RepID=A0AA88VB37_9ASTE|nr:hypothetical protein RJ639_016912 [Escallonia herrerae]
MSSVFQSIQKKGSNFMGRNQASLPVSQSAADAPNVERVVRRRSVLSSLSLNGLSTDPKPSLEWAFRRSKSVSSMGEYAGTSVRKWWDWGWSWILSRKPTFARDLEMNEEESSVLGSQSKGSWGHVFYKVRSELKRLVGADHSNVGLPQTFRYQNSPYNTYSSQHFQVHGVGKAAQS